jgi:hypothetical protein
MGWMRNAYKILAGKLERKRPPGRNGCRRDENIKEGKGKVVPVLN